MAEALSVAGSIAGLVSIADVVFRRIYHYVKTVSNAEKEVLRLKEEVGNLTGVLHNLLLIAQDLEDDSNTRYSVRVDHVNSCLAVLHDLKKKLDDVQIHRGGKQKLKNLGRRLKWPYTSQETDTFIDRIRAQRELLNLSLSADSMIALLQSLSTQKDLSSQLASIQETIRSSQEVSDQIYLDEYRERVLKAFLLVDPRRNYEISLALRHPTTGFWLTQGEQFKDWLSNLGSRLWLTGIPGAGKTVLSGLMIQECIVRANPRRAVAYFYCDYKNLNSQTPISILGALAAQLARQHEDSFTVLKNYYNSLHPRDQLEKPAKAEELVTVIQEIAYNFQDVRLIIDGLDECGDNSREAADSLAKLVSGSTEIISLACLSRREVDICDIFEPLLFEHIEVAAHTRDLDQYVRGELEQRTKDKRIRIRSADLKELIVEKLVSRADGMSVLTSALFCMHFPLTPLHVTGFAGLLASWITYASFLLMHLAVKH